MNIRSSSSRFEGGGTLVPVRPIVSDCKTGRSQP